MCSQITAITVSMQFILPLILQVQLHFYVHSLARELDPSSWTMCPAEALKLDLLTVVPIQLAFITVPTLKMLGFGVETVRVLYLVIGLYTGVILQIAHPLFVHVCLYLKVIYTVAGCMCVCLGIDSVCVCVCHVSWLSYFVTIDSVQIQLHRATSYS